ncbi:MAG TPA: transposase [Pyrinomonadaceae bacterium]|nr:transposase [Pyrinomonadaceae bacterium]
MNYRELKARQIVDRANIKKAGNLWLVPSQSGRGQYKVNTEKQTCSCPDYDFRRAKCKHIFAVEIIERTQTTTTTETPDGTKTTTTIEKIKVTRKTYSQVWPAYNAAQTEEKRLFQYLLRQLCEGVGEPAQTNGRPRLPIEDILFSMAFKVYSTVSGRRFISDLKDAHGKGYLSKLPAYNSIFRYFEDEMLTPHLQMLIEESSLPLSTIEQDFAVDSSGLSTCQFVQWMHAKYSEPHLIEKKDWIKLHIMCGVKTNVVTAVEITDRHANDSPVLKPLVEATRRNFAMQEVSADKAYLSNKNLATIVANQAMPYIPFKANTTGHNQSDLFKRMFHFYSYNQERFMQNYHKRSNVETTFHMIKSKFGAALRSRTKTAQINEALCKVLCHNICCLIQSMFELNLKPKFWSEAA